MADDAHDAALWRALMSVPRIRMQGSAGIDPNTLERRFNYGRSVHFGMELWTDMGDDYDRSKDPQNAVEWGLACIRGAAERMLEKSQGMPQED